MNASELSVFLRLGDFILSLLSGQASYEWGWRMHPMWGSGWGIGMTIMMPLFRSLSPLSSARDGSSVKAKILRETRR